MANYVFNISKGRVGEFANRVKVGDPAASRLFMIALSTDVAQATAQDVADFAALVTAGAVEATNAGYTKKTLTGADIATQAMDTAGDKYWVDLNDQTWAAVTAGGAWVALVVCYSAVTAPTNLQMVPMTHHDFAVTPDGSDIVAQIAATGIWQAT